MKDQLNQYKQDFKYRIFSKTQYLVDKRIRTNVSQDELAKKFDVSLKTIQRFENYESENTYLVFCYNSFFS